jgi:hypothetical protein
VPCGQHMGPGVVDESCWCSGIFQNSGRCLQGLQLQVHPVPAAVRVVHHGVLSSRKEPASPHALPCRPPSPAPPPSPPCSLLLLAAGGPCYEGFGSHGAAEQLVAGMAALDVRPAHQLAQLAAAGTGLQWLEAHWAKQL